MTPAAWPRNLSKPSKPEVGIANLRARKAASLEYEAEEQPDTGEDEA